MIGGGDEVLGGGEKEREREGMKEGGEVKRLDDQRRGKKERR